MDNQIFIVIFIDFCVRGQKYIQQDNACFQEFHSLVYKARIYGTKIAEIIQKWTAEYWEILKELVLKFGQEFDRWKVIINMVIKIAQ